MRAVATCQWAPPRAYAGPGISSAGPERGLCTGTSAAACTGPGIGRPRQQAAARLFRNRARTRTTQRHALLRSCPAGVDTVHNIVQRPSIDQVAVLRA